MNQNIPFLSTLESVTSKEGFFKAQTEPPFDTKPDEIRCDGEEFPRDSKISDLANKIKDRLVLAWGDFDNGQTLILKADGAFGIYVEKTNFDEKTTLSTLKRYDWQIATFGSIHTGWGSEFDYYSPGFGSPLGSLGWGCAFKGEGHNRIVSRRFLEHGPWRTIRDEEHDITLIQFHDLEADAATALDQARVGHDFIAAPLEGGFYQRNLRLKSTEFSGVYDPDEKKQIMLIPAHDLVTRAQMMDACKIRHFQLLGESKPLENVAFVFVGGEAEAQPYLPEMWMRGLEVYAIDKGIEHRLDLDYAPNLEKPEWVQRLENA
jgi:hypothetical protein